MLTPLAEKLLRRVALRPPPPAIAYPQSLPPEQQRRLQAALRRSSGIFRPSGPRRGAPVRAAGQERAGAALWSPVFQAAAQGVRAPHSSSPRLQARD